MTDAANTLDECSARSWCCWACRSASACSSSTARSTPACRSPWSRLLDVEKDYEGKRPKTWVSISAAGRAALAAEMAALRALMTRHDDALT
jgi:hypothetical protein